MYCTMHVHISLFTIIGEMNYPYVLNSSGDVYGNDDPNNLLVLPLLCTLIYLEFSLRTLAAHNVSKNSNILEELFQIRPCT